jgi:hypothetical protein
MDRLCERPGCSDRASVAYGMRPEDLVFWLDVLPVGVARAGGVLCRRHADSMVVPRGWTLDDLRDPDLHLFRPPAAAPVADPGRSGRARVARRETSAPAQLAFDAVPEAVVTSVLDAAPESTTWSPEFDEADDLDGLLDARGPLLSRAFRTAERVD